MPNRRDMRGSAQLHRNDDVRLSFDELPRYFQDIRGVVTRSKVRLAPVGSDEAKMP